MSKENIAFGTIKIASNGAGYVTPEAPVDGDDRDIFIEPSLTNGAFSGDRVRVELFRQEITLNSRGVITKNRKQGKISEILEKTKRTFSGGVYENNGKYYVLCDGNRFDGGIKLVGDLKGINPGDKIVFEMISLPAGKVSGKASVIEVTGKCGEQGAEISAIVKAKEIPVDFSAETIEEALLIEQVIDEPKTEDLIKKGRADYRNKIIVTIDSEETKDVDDGVSIEILPNGNYLLGVHIADVSEYVKKDSPLDRDAYERGTSVYLPDRVIPMLPRALSNGICSLNVGENRLALSVLMEIDKTGSVVNHEIKESIVKVAYKITYKELYRLFEGADEEKKELLPRFREHIDDLKAMRELASILDSRRAREGYIGFDVPEQYVTLDANGKVTGIGSYEMTFANRIIEEFMLICNMTVASHFFFLNIPFIYRVHPAPEKDRVDELSTFVKALGFHFKGGVGGNVHPGAFADLLEEAKGTSKERLINTMALRTMQKAVYKSECLGHFGLGTKYYTHFTSPIRRYPDLLIHRIIKQVIRRENCSEATEDEYNAFISYYEKNNEEIAIQCSEREKNAADTERECVDYLTVEYMTQFLGQQFEATVSSVTSFGFFVVLDNSVEGLVRYSSLRDHYYFDSMRMTAVNERDGRTVFVGKPINVILESAIPQLRQIDFIPADEAQHRAVKKRVFKKKHVKSKMTKNKRRKGKGR